MSKLGQNSEKVPQDVSAFPSNNEESGVLKRGEVNHRKPKRDDQEERKSQEEESPVSALVYALGKQKRDGKNNDKIRFFSDSSLMVVKREAFLSCVKMLDINRLVSELNTVTRLTGEPVSVKYKHTDHDHMVIWFTDKVASDKPDDPTRIPLVELDNIRIAEVLYLSFDILDCDTAMEVGQREMEKAATAFCLYARDKISEAFEQKDPKLTSVIKHYSTRGEEEVEVMNFMLDALKENQFEGFFSAPSEENSAALQHFKDWRNRAYAFMETACSFTLRNPADVWVNRGFLPKNADIYDRLSHRKTINFYGLNSHSDESEQELLPEEQALPGSFVAKVVKPVQPEVVIRSSISWSESSSNYPTEKSSWQRKSRATDSSELLSEKDLPKNPKKLPSGCSIL